jgi:predicted ArsR family transcriptional regulator
MKYRSSLETNILILATLLENKEYPQYDLPEAIKKDYRTVLRHLRVLEHSRLIKVVRTERSQKGGKDKNIYGLTQWGLIAILPFLAQLEKQKEEVFYKNVEEIAAKHKDLLPLILGKLDFFTEQGINTLVLRRFRNAAQNIHSSLQYASDGDTRETEQLFQILSRNGKSPIWERQYKKVSEAQKSIIENIDQMTEEELYKKVFLGFGEPSQQQEQRKLFDALSQDREIRVFISQEMETLERQSGDYLKNIHFWRDYWTNIIRT